MSASPHECVVLDARVVAGSGGGPDKTLLNSPRFLTHSGYRMLCVYLRPPGDEGFDQIRQKAAACRAELVEVDDRGPLDLQIVPKLLTLCRRLKARIWHGHDYKTNALGLLLARFWPMRLVTTVHGWVHHTRRTPLYYWVDRLSLPYYEKVLCVSPDLITRCRESGVPADRLDLLENGIDVEQNVRRSSPAEAKKKLGFPAGVPLIGAVGRLSPEKGFDLLLRSAARLRDAGQRFRLMLIGDGSERSALEQLVASLNLGDRVTLTGWRTDLPAWYEAMDVYALSSHREGLPNVLLEAMALEVPVVATAVNGVPRLVTDGTSGLLIPAGSEEALTGALARLLDDPALRRRLAAGGRQTIEERYSFAFRMDRLRQLYDSMLGRSARAA